MTTIETIPQNSVIQSEKKDIQMNRKKRRKIEDPRLNDSIKLVICMVGLPARGKSYISNNILRYLTWKEINTKIFNLGQYRREIFGAGQSSEWFSSNNEESTKIRHELFKTAMNDLIKFITTEGQVAILDATNTTKSRRKNIIDTLTSVGIPKQNIIFIESICNNDLIVAKNILDQKLSNPDYKNVDTQKAINDFKNRIKEYEQVYETLDEKSDEDKSFIKIIDVGKTIITHNIKGYLAVQLSNYLKQTHIGEKTIFLTRHGESVYSTEQRVGGDSSLTKKGKCYAKVLKKFMEERIKEDEEVLVWTSSLKRSIETAKYMQKHPFKQCHWRALDEIFAGVCDGLTYDEIKEKYPKEYKRRCEDKLSHRYPRGESYKDLMARVDQVIMELEASDRKVLLVSHQAVIRVLYSYFVGVNPKEYVNTPIPLYTVYEIVPNSYATKVTKHDLTKLVEEEFQRRKNKRKNSSSNLKMHKKNSQKNENGHQ